METRYKIKEKNKSTSQCVQTKEKMLSSETYLLILNFFLHGHRRMSMVRWGLKMKAELADQQQKSPWERHTSETGELTKTEKYSHKDHKCKVKFLYGFL